MNQRTNQYSLQKEAPKRSYYDKNRAHVISSHAYIKFQICFSKDHCLYSCQTQQRYMPSCQPIPTCVVCFKNK